MLRQKLFVQYWRTGRLIAFMLLRVFSLTWSCLLVPTILSFRFLTHVLPKLKYEEKLCVMSCVNDLTSTLGHRKNPRKKSTDHVDTKKCTLWRSKKNNASRAAHILGSFFFLAFLYKTTWSTKIECFPLQREHTANYVPVTAYVECSANRKSLTPEQFAIIGNLLTFLLVLQE